MSKFGKYAIIDPVKYVFEKEPTWYWKIKPPTALGELEVSRLLLVERVRVEPDGTKSTMIVTALEVAMREIAASFAGTNMIEGWEGNASIEDVEELLGSMPRELVLEIWQAVGEAIPGWGPVTKKKKSKPEDEEKK